MKLLWKTGMIAGAISFATAGYSASLDFTSVEGFWQSSTPSVSGLGTDKIRWGTDLGQGQSGYDFDPTNGPFTADEGESFVLGVFTHLNLPIQKTLLESADLSVTFSIEGLSDSITSVFSFDHLESFNQAATCANGQANTVGVNVNGCADRVVATLNDSLSETFEIDGTTYILDVLGFQHNGASFTEFWTTEEAINTAELIGTFKTVVADFSPTPPPTNGPTPPTNGPTPPPTVPSVPLPASGLMLMAGVCALVLRRKLA